MTSPHPAPRSRKKVVKEVVAIDDPLVCGTIAFGYSNKKEAISAMFAHNGFVMPDEDLLVKKRVIKGVRDGEPYFYWGDVCECCGSKNKGYWSWLELA